MSLLSVKALKLQSSRKNNLRSNTPTRCPDNNKDKGMEKLAMSYLSMSMLRKLSGIYSIKKAIITSMKLASINLNKLNLNK